MKLAAFCLLSLVVLLGCGHTTTTEKPTTEKPTREEGTAPRPHEGVKSPPPNASKTPVVESPEALLNPGAEDEIRTKLVAGGYLEDAHAKSLERGLRKFQAAKDLPVTGVPDHETVRRLGLDPNKLFRRAEPKP